VTLPERSTETPTQSPDRGQIIRFRPRGGAPGWRLPLPGSQPPQWPDDNFEKFERTETPEDYRHRMKMNLLGFAVTILLMAVGAWLATTLAEIQKNQDCYLSGRGNCMKIPVPTQR
jgi:hypothetical protein